jgi:hypothetical protein
MRGSAMPLPWVDGTSDTIMIDPPASSDFG